MFPLSKPHAESRLACVSIWNRIQFEFS